MTNLDIPALNHLIHGINFLINFFIISLIFGLILAPLGFYFGAPKIKENKKDKK
jgi:hypothetical protein